MTYRVNLNPNQKTLRLIIVAVAVSFLTISCTNSDNEIKTSKQYNYVVIFADDMGYGDLGVYGHPTIKTPYLDQMAAEGQKWTNFYVGASVCTPSRAALLTGRLPIRSGMAGEHNRVLFPDSEGGLPESEITIAEQLKKGGYSTAGIGKWHLGHKEQYLPTNNGFDYYFGIPYSNDMDNVVLQSGKSGMSYIDFWKSPERQNTATFNVPLMKNTEIIERPANQNTITKRYTEEAVNYIKQNKERPFFLYLAHNLPHVPLFASGDFKGKSLRGIYGDVVEEIDFSVGQILKTLKEEGLAENTIVVFTSDNGPWLIMNSEGGSAGLLKDGKGSTWEGGMREPCIFWSPGNIEPGVITDLGTTMDLFATFSSLSHIAMPDDREMDAVDLSPVLLENKSGKRNNMFYYRNRELYAVRLGAYKAHLITQGAYGQPAKEYHETPLLYDLNIDPSEKYNIADEHPEVIAEIMALIEEHNEKMIKGKDQLEQRTPI